MRESARATKTPEEAADESTEASFADKRKKDEPTGLLLND
jgi:hypothetical protein